MSDNVTEFQDEADQVEKRIKLIDEEISIKRQVRRILKGNQESSRNPKNLFQGLDRETRHTKETKENKKPEFPIKLGALTGCTGRVSILCVSRNTHQVMSWVYEREKENYDTVNKSVLMVQTEAP